ncbi:MAG: sigma-70 family RNA polymerase sigma factor [Candidatus Omnitrophica bacterium]|nr:sigma-70 family RNA polymerase sigma factor [Candidatus Omnitrophota bacterium]
MPDETKDLEQIFRLCAQGDNNAWALFVEMFTPLVNRAIRHKALSLFMRLSSDDADEIYQQTFTNIWRRKSLERIAKAKSIPAYLTVIAQHATIDFFRENIHQDNTKQAWRQNQLYQPRPGIGPRDIAEDNCLSETINEFIKGLTEKEQRVMSLELVHQLKHREIAFIMGIPVNTVSTIISRLKQALRQRLEEKGYGI